MPSQSIIDLLARTAIFETLSQQQLAEISKVTVPRRFQPGEIVFHAGDEGDSCYLLRSGHARAVRTNIDGRTITLAHFGPGDIFGELALFDNETRSATVETIDHVEVLAILGNDMRRLLRQNAEMAAEFVIALGRRLRAANERLASQSSSRCPTGSRRCCGS